MLISALLSIASTMSAPADMVIVVIDDMGWADPSCMPDGRHQTPTLDMLATSGALFTHATANGPNCAPSRACLMTGQWTPRHGIFTVGPAKQGKAQLRTLNPPRNRTSLPKTTRTIAEHLQDAGWRTAHVGKWHLGNDPLDHGFDSNIAGTAKGHPKSYTAPYSNPKLPDGPDGEHLTDRLADEAIALLQKDDERPLFLYLPFFAVHTPLQANRDEVDQVLEANPDWTRRQAVYDCMVRRTDAALGRVLEHVSDDALVMVMSDHGGVGRLANNGVLKGCKGQLYEGGLRTPLIISGPGVDEGRVINTPVSLHELAPTMLAAAGAPADPAHDGRSLWPLLKGDVDVHRGPQYWHFPAYLPAAGAVDGPWRSTPVSAIRIGDFKLLEFHETNQCELYDLHHDPGETENLADTQPVVRDAMRTLLRSWREDTGARMPAPL
ncbi:MAG: sulfatase [Phycisphaerales bacterium]|nr:sulfatase [Phycisphaerales bacterium]